MDWTRESTQRHQPLPAPVELIEERPALGHPALIGPNLSGRLLAFSARAVNHAAAVLAHWQIRWIHHPLWFVSWGNGLAEEGRIGYRSGYGSPGLQWVDVGEFCLVFCDGVLGPLGKVEWQDGTWQFTASPGLDIRGGEDGTFTMRGAGVADGWWQSGRIEPFAGESGWLYRPRAWPFEEGRK
jgi:hypothetical protein